MSEALDILLAVACCTAGGLTCEKCPRYGDEPAEDGLSGCKDWTEEELEQAARFLIEDRERRKQRFMLSLQRLQEHEEGGYEDLHDIQGDEAE